MKKRSILSALAVTSVLALSACGGGGSDPLSGGGNTGGSEGSQVIVGSADFTESQLIGSIYSQALQAAGVTDEGTVQHRQPRGVHRGPQGRLHRSGPRVHRRAAELPRPEVDRRDAGGGVGRTRRRSCRRASRMLTPSPAEDKDVVAVTQATADKYKLKTISDLKPVAGELVLGGPPEWKTRTQGVVGLRDVYGLNFKDFVSLDAGGTLTMTALTNGQIQAGDLFSTDPGLHANHLVALEDDKNLFAAENVVPLIKSAKQNDTIKKTLDAVSAKLTTDDLISMNAEAATGTNLSDIAKKWLANAGISSN